MATWAEAVEQQNSRKVLLAEIGAGKRLSTWEQHVTYTATWSSYVGHRVLGRTAPSTLAGVTEDGAGLTLAASLSACNTTNASYFFNSSTETVHVNPTQSDPHDAVIIARVVLTYATHPKVFTGLTADPVQYFSRLVSAPAVSLRTAEEFDGVGQLGGGGLTLDNGDALFDGMRDLEWDYDTVSLKLGLDVMR